MSNQPAPFKPSFTDTSGLIITRDGLPIAQTHNTLAWFHKNTAQSMHWAIENEGYAVFESSGSTSDEAIARGYSMYLTIASRRGYGIEGYIIRTIEEFQALTLQDGPSLHQDYVFEHVAREQLDAIERSLNYLAGSLGAIAGILSTWIEFQRSNFGIEA